MSDEWSGLSVLVVGAGSIGRRHTRILRELGVGDIRVCDTSPERLEAARRDFGITAAWASFDESLHSRPDAVFVCSPTALHVQQAAASLEAGADVFIEKPLSTSLDGIERLEEAAREGGRVVMVGHCFRFHEGLLRAKTAIDQGRIGRLVSIRCMVGEYIPEVMPSYKSMYISQYSGAYELMHEIDLALWFANQAPDRVTALDGSASDVGMKSPDLVEAIIRFGDRSIPPGIIPGGIAGIIPGGIAGIIPGGIAGIIPGGIAGIVPGGIASVHLDFLQRARRRQTELMGTEGTAIIEFARWDKCVLSIYEAVKGQWVVEEIDTDRDDMFRAEDGAFLEACARRSAPPVSIADGRLAVSIMLAAQESSASGTAVAPR